MGIWEEWDGVGCCVYVPCKHTGMPCMNRQGVDMRVACTHLHSDDTHEDRMKIKSLHWMMRTSHPNQKPKLQEFRTNFHIGGGRTFRRFHHVGFMRQLLPFNRKTVKDSIVIWCMRCKASRKRIRVEWSKSLFVVFPKGCTTNSCETNDDP